MKKRTQQTIFLVWLALLAPFSVGQAAEADPTLTAKRLIIENSERLVKALKEQSEAIKKDRDIAYKLVEDIVLPHVDFQRVARLVLGKYWRQADAQQREKFTREFRTLLIRTYVTAMVEYSAQIISHSRNVRYLPYHESADSNDVSVRMEIKLPDRAPVHVNYRLFRENGDVWKIYDLSVEGVSLATTYRSTFASEIRRGGIDELIAKLSERNQQATN
jgi:phospholipid transport system substrate-binding protein